MFDVTSSYVFGKLCASSKGGRVEGENEMAISGLGYRKHLLRTGQGVFSFF